jgi:hypothetical protein
MVWQTENILTNILSKFHCDECPIIREFPARGPAVHSPRPQRSSPCPLCYSCRLIPTRKSKTSIRMSPLCPNSHFLARRERLQDRNIWWKRKASAC